MTGSIRRVSLYPFSREAADLVEEEGFNIADLAYHPDLEGARRNALRRLVSAISSGVDVEIDEIKPINDVYSFIIARVVMERLNDRVLRNSFAEHEAKRFFHLSEGESLRNMLDLALEGFSMTTTELEGGGLMLPYEQFIELSTGIGGANWRLVNRDVRAGQVALSPRECRRLLSEAGRRHLLSPAEVEGELPEPLEEMCRTVSRLISKRRPRFRARRIRNLAPCLQELLDRASRGENLPHQARFALAAYLLKVSWGIEKVIDAFRAIPDFKEEATRYQVTQIAEKGYLPPNCSRMKSLGLCTADCGVSNPLSFRRRGGG